MAPFGHTSILFVSTFVHTFWPNFVTALVPMSHIFGHGSLAAGGRGGGEIEKEEEGEEKRERRKRRKGRGGGEKRAKEEEEEEGKGRRRRSIRNASQANPGHSR